jgi:hypothetical protein
MGLQIGRALWQMVTVALAQQHQRHGLAHDVAASDHHGMLAAQVRSRWTPASSCNHRVCRALKPGATINAPALATWKPSTSLAGEMVSMTLCVINVLGQGQLNQDAVDGWVVVEGVNAGQQFGLRHGRFMFSSTECRPAFRQALTLLRT